jgi:hypothetical protein
MSACAGSSTDASRANRSRCRPASLVLVHVGTNLGLFLAARVGFSSISPAWSRWIALGRIGFMSTQRREDRRLASCTDRAGAPGWVTTNSRRSDRRNQQRVRLVDLYIRFGSPPLRQAAARRPLLKSSSGFPPDPSLAVFARLHPALPRVPAAMRCRTERYDGKRDLYFQHAT